MSNNVIILAGGQGKRMKTEKPKVLCNVLGEPMLEWVLTACENAELDKKDINLVGHPLISKEEKKITRKTAESRTVGEQ